jgi:hypothetical protein
MASRDSRTIQNNNYVIKKEPKLLQPGHVNAKLSDKVLTENSVKNALKGNSKKEYAYFDELHNNQGVVLGGDRDRQSKLKSQLHQSQFENSLSIDAVYFADEATTLYKGENGGYDTKRPRAFLIDPVPRMGTSKSDFGLEPCGGGIKGRSRYMANPGEKMEIQWIIENPAPNSHCMLRISRGSADDSESYEKVYVEGRGYDSSTGKFKCGDRDSAIEIVKATMPYDTSCPDCVLQWVYDAPGYGLLYQCVDISVLDEAHREDCQGKCKNGGICQSKKCYCEEGYSGDFCEIETKAAKEAEKYDTATEKQQQARIAAIENNSSSHESSSSSSGIGFFGWYFILLLISLLVIGAILVLSYFFCHDRAERLIKGDHQYREEGHSNRDGDNRSDIQKRSNVDQKKRDDENKNI